MDGLGVGLAVCRSVITLAVVSAIFGLELLVMSQASEGRDSSRRWTLGAWLVVLAGVMGALCCVLGLKEMSINLIANIQAENYCKPGVEINVLVACLVVYYLFYNH